VLTTKRANIDAFLKALSPQAASATEPPPTPNNMTSDPWPASDRPPAGQSGSQSGPGCRFEAPGAERDSRPR